MPNKEIRIKATLDQSDFDNQINTLQQRLQQMQRTFQQAASAQQNFGGGKMGDYAKTFFGDYNKDSIRNLQEAFNINARKLQHESKDLRTKQDELGKLEKIEGKITKEQATRIKGLQDEIKLIKERGQAIVQQNLLYKQSMEQMGATPEQFDKLKGSGRKTQAEIAEEKRQQDEITRQEKREERNRQMSAAFGVASAVGAVAYAGSQIGQHRVQRDRVFLGELAQQQQIVNMNTNNILRGQGARNMYEAEERGAALRAAQKEMSGQAEVDKWKLVGEIAGKVAIGAKGGSMAGGAWGAVAGGALGLGHALSDRRNFNMMFDKEAYQNQLQTDMFKNFEQNLAARKMMDPGKFMAQEMWSQNWQKFQGLERLTGIGTKGLLGEKAREYAFPSREDVATSMLKGGAKYKGMTAEQMKQIPGMTEEFQSSAMVSKELERRKDEQRADVDKYNEQRKKGWLQQQMEVGGQAMFSQERIEQNLQGILQAGGTTAYAKGGGAKSAALFQRMGLFNAPQQLGALSSLGGMGGFEGAPGVMGDKTDDAYLRLLSEGVKLGLDTSEMREETRRWQDAVTEIFVKSGGAEGAVQQFALGNVGFGAKELAAAGGAMQEYNQRAGEAEGYRGALKWSYMQSSDKWSKVPYKLKAWAASQNPATLDKNDPILKELGNYMGGTDAAMKEITEGVVGSSMAWNPMTDKEKKEFKSGYEDYLKGQNLQAGAEAMQKYVNTAEGQTKYTEMTTGFGLQEKADFDRMNWKEKMSFMQQYMGAAKGMVPEVAETEMPGEMGKTGDVIPSLEDLVSGKSAMPGIPTTKRLMKTGKFVPEDETSMAKLMQFQKQEGLMKPLSEAEKQEASLAKDNTTQLNIMNGGMKEMTLAAMNNTKSTEANTQAILNLTTALSGGKTFAEKGGEITKDMSDKVKNLFGLAADEKVSNQDQQTVGNGVPAGIAAPEGQ